MQRLCFAARFTLTLFFHVCMSMWRAACRQRRAWQHKRAQLHPSGSSSLSTWPSRWGSSFQGGFFPSPGVLFLPGSGKRGSKRAGLVVHVRLCASIYTLTMHASQVALVLLLPWYLWNCICIHASITWNTMTVFAPPPHPPQASAHPPSTAALHQRVRDLEHQLQQLRGGIRGGADVGKPGVTSAGSPSAAAGARGLFVAPSVRLDHCLHLCLQKWSFLLCMICICGREGESMQLRHIACVSTCTLMLLCAPC